MRTIIAFSASLPVSRSSRPLIRILVCLLITTAIYYAFAVSTATAATYYVDDVNGNDANTGDSIHPWKTLARAMEANGKDPNVNQGDTVYFYDGNYGTYSWDARVTGNVPINNTNWITYKAVTGHTPKINNVFIYNTRSGYANGNSYTCFDGFRILNGISAQYDNHLRILNCTITRLPDYNASGVYSPYYLSATYGIYTKEINDVSIIGNTIYNTTKGMNLICTANNITRDYNVIGNIIYRLGSDGISIGASDINISDNYIYDMNVMRSELIITGTKSGNFTIGEEVTQAGTNATGVVTQNASSTIMCCFNTSSQRFLSSADGGGTITGASSGQTIIPSTSVDGEHADGIECQCATNTVHISNVSVERNRILCAKDYWLVNGGVKFGSATPEYVDNVLFRNNLVSGYQVLLSSLQGNITISDNTFDCFLQVYHTYNDTNCIIDVFYNNIIRAPLINKDAYGGITNFQKHGNNIFGNNPNGTGGPSYPFVINGTELVNYDINSLFVNAANNDFNLAPHSAAINFGNFTYAPATDILGNARDANHHSAGCYEYITYTLNTTAVNGTVAKSPDKTNYNSGDTVTLTATPNIGYNFANWSGDASGSSNPVTITMNANKSVTANFAVNTFTLGYTAGSGGTLTGNTSQVVNYGANGTAVTAVPNTGYYFVNWSDASTANPRTDLNVTANIAVTANFAINTFTLNYSAGANGTLTGNTSQVVNYGANGTAVTAVPNTGYYFVNWSDASTANPRTDLNVTANIAVTANFAVQTPDPPTTYTLSITATNGSVTKTPDKTSYNSGDTVTLTATPNTGYNFANWSGDASGTNSSVTITMNSNKSVTANLNAIVDNTAPNVTGLSPAADSIQIPLDRLVILHVADNGDGVDANSVTIKVNDNIVYTGDTADYNSPYGCCHRTGAKADYTFIYQPNAAFDYDQKVSVVVNAQDLAGNAMSPYSYSFVTETRSFGEHKMVNSISKNIGNGHPATVRDSAGNIWVAWHAGSVSSSGMKRGIYVGKLPAGADNFGTSIREANNTSDRCNAALAIDAYDKLYLAWQDNRRKKWDIYMSTSVDGINWSTETRVTDSDNNAVNPVIAVDHSLPPKAYIAWQDDRTGNQEIYIASSSDGFATDTISRITSDSSDHIKPAIAVDSANTVYVVWADSRNGSSDIYGAASNNRPWANVPIVTKPGNQTNPAIATEATGTILHLLWVDDAAGNKDIYYAESNGLSEISLAGRNIVDDNSGADQLTPVIITTGSTGASLRVFACWQDMRNIVKSGNTDLYFVEVNHGKETNVFVGNNAISSNKSAPVIGVDRYGYPYLVWVDDRNQNTDIYYAGSTFVHSNALASQNVSPASDAIIGTEPANITGVNDVSVVVPAGAYPCELNITISKVENPPKLPVSIFTFPYEFGPGGADFNQPVTITIPYSVSASKNPAFAYWYNTLADVLSQQGITNVETITISPTLYAIRFKTTHFTQFIVGGSVDSSIQVTKCTIIAGSKDNSDKISISGKIDATADNFNDAAVIEVTVDSNDMVNPCVLTFPINSKTFKKDKYSYSGTENGVKKSFKYDVKTHNFTSAANKVNLSGLDCPLTLDINVGDYIGTAEVNETIVNGQNKPIPIILLMGVKYSLKVDKCQVKPGKKKPNTDQLLVKGSFTVEDTDANMANRVSEGLVVVLDTQTFTIPTNELKAGKGKFTCSKAEVTEGGIATTSFDFNKCSFILTIKNTNITASSGTVDFGVAFAGYSQIRQITLM